MAKRLARVIVVEATERPTDPLVARRSQAPVTPAGQITGRAPIRGSSAADGRPDYRPAGAVHGRAHRQRHSSSRPSTCSHPGWSSWAGARTPRSSAWARPMAFTTCVVPDGAGGAYVAWVDSRLGAPDIYLTRLTSCRRDGLRLARGGIAGLLGAAFSVQPRCLLGRRGRRDFSRGRTFALGTPRRSTWSESGRCEPLASGWTDGGVPVASGAPDQYSPCSSPMEQAARSSSGRAVSRTGSVRACSISRAAGSAVTQAGRPPERASDPGTEGVAGPEPLSRRARVSCRSCGEAPRRERAGAQKSARLDPSQSPTRPGQRAQSRSRAAAMEISEPRLARSRGRHLLVGLGANGATAQGALKAADARRQRSDRLRLAGRRGSRSPTRSRSRRRRFFPARAAHSRLGGSARTARASDIYAARLNRRRHSKLPTGSRAGCRSAPRPGSSTRPQSLPMAMEARSWCGATRVSEAAGSFLAARRSGVDPARLIKVETNSGYARITWAGRAADRRCVPGLPGHDPQASGTCSACCRPTTARTSCSRIKPPRSGTEVQYRLGDPEPRARSDS